MLYDARAAKVLQWRDMSHDTLIMWRALKKVCSDVIWRVWHVDLQLYKSRNMMPVTWNCCTSKMTAPTNRCCDVPLTNSRRMLLVTWGLCTNQMTAPSNRCWGMCYSLITTDLLPVSYSCAKVICNVSVLLQQKRYVTFSRRARTRSPAQEKNWRREICNV